MIALYIVLSVLALVLFLLFLPIRVYLSYNEKITVYLSVLGIRFPLYPKPQKARKKRKKTAKKPAAALPAEAKKSEKKGLRYYTKMLRLFLRILKRTQERLRRSFKISVLEMRASVATGDAATTAILYGVVSQGFSYVLALADTFLKTSIREKNVAVYPNYVAEASDFRVRIKFSSNLFLLLRVAIRTLFHYFKEKTVLNNKTKTEDQKNG